MNLMAAKYGCQIFENMAAKSFNICGFHVFDKQRPHYKSPPWPEFGEYSKFVPSSPQKPKWANLFFINANQVQAELELADGKRLCEHVSRIVSSVNFLNRDLSFSNGFSDEVILDINMLRPLMIHLIFSQVNGTLTITENDNSTLV